MVGRWLGVWLGVCLVAGVNTKVDLDSPLRLAHCRANCLYEMKVQSSTDEMCHASSECSQCWSGCGRLQGADTTSTTAYCSSTRCHGGCRVACKFYSSTPLHNPPVLLTHHEEALSVNEHRVSWPPAAGPHAVYVVMGRLLDHHWTQLGQTLDPAWSLSSAVESGSVRVLVVDWRGLAKVMSPPPESPLVQVRTIIRSLGLENVMGLRNQSEMVGDTSITNSTQGSQDEPWPLRQVSMIRQSGLVLAQVSWHPFPTPQDYLVTWQLDGGILRGNLVTNSSLVTLSLWPDSLYRIQVSVLSRGSSVLESDPLVLDTHHPIRAARPQSSTRTDPHTQLVAGVAAAVVVFLAVTFTATWRWHHRLSLPHSKLLDEESGSPTLYRVFPPAVRPIGGGQDFLPDMFSSTDNLLQVN